MSKDESRTINIPKNIACNFCVSGTKMTNKKYVYLLRDISNYDFLNRYNCKICNRTGRQPIPLSEIL